MDKHQRLVREVFEKKKETMKSGGAKPKRKYVYADELMFPHKLSEMRETEDSSTESIQESQGVSTAEETLKASATASKVHEPRRRQKPGEVEMKLLKCLERDANDDPCMTFF
jgi:hypothetical protein